MASSGGLLWTMVGVYGLNDGQSNRRSVRLNPQCCLPLKSCGGSHNATFLSLFVAHRDITSMPLARVASKATVKWRTSCIIDLRDTIARGEDQTGRKGYMWFHT